MNRILRYASNEKLAAELLRRGESNLATSDGRLSGSTYKLAGELFSRFCVDGAPVRVGEDGQVEFMAIERNTGSQAGKLCLIGGGVERVPLGDGWGPKSVEQALREHFRTDLGYEIEPISGWNHPNYLAQDMRPIDGELLPGFELNPASRHLLAARYIVKITNGDEAPQFGSTSLGGQEASDVVWFNRDEMPEADAFGYGHHHTYEAFFDQAEAYRARGLLSTPQQGAATEITN